MASEGRFQPLACPSLAEPCPLTPPDVGRYVIVVGDYTHIFGARQFRDILDILLNFFVSVKSLAR